MFTGSTRHASRRAPYEDVCETRHLKPGGWMSDSPDQSNPIPPDILRLWPDVVARLMPILPKGAAAQLKLLVPLDIDGSVLILNGMQHAPAALEKHLPAIYSTFVSVVGLTVIKSVSVVVRQGPRQGLTIDEMLSPARKAEGREKPKTAKKQLFAGLDQLNFPIGWMFPQRVPRIPKQKLCTLCGVVSTRAAKACTGCGKRFSTADNPCRIIDGEMQNFWVGRNGQFVHIIEGGYWPDGTPRGIPGHSFPLTVTTDLCTQFKLQISSLGITDNLTVILGETLPGYGWRLGFRGNLRGKGDESDPKKNKPVRFIERLEQYLHCTHRVRKYKTEDEAKAEYKRIKEQGFVDDSTTALVEDVVPPLTEYKIWSKAELGYDPVRGFVAHVTLTPEFKREVVDHSVPLVPWIVAKLIPSPQRLSIYSWFTHRIHSLLISEDYKNRVGPDWEWTSWIRVQSLQDQIGMNGDESHRRAGDTLNAMESVQTTVAEWCTMVGRPDCNFVFEVRGRGDSHYWAEFRIKASERAIHSQK
jgi:hypothetical protein